MHYCGLKEVDITPELGLHIPGQLYIRVSDAVKDPLHAKAAALGDDHQTFIVLALDLLCIDHEDAEQIRQRIVDETGLAAETILIAATHTHTGAPAVAAYGHTKDRHYTETMIRKAADAGIQAYHDRQPVVLSAAVSTIKDYSFNRRFLMKDGSYRTNPGLHNPLVDRPAGPVDPDLTILMVKKPDGTPLGAVVNFACHLDIAGGTALSADYPGELSSCLKDAYGDSFVTVFLTGACGNINHVNIDNEKTMQKDYYREIGRYLAERVLSAEYSEPFADHQVINMGCERLTLSPRRPESRQIEQAYRCAHDDAADGNDRFFANELLYVADHPYADETAIVQVFQIGPLMLVGLPGEVFTEFGLDIKKQAHQPYCMIDTLSNGNYGYIATREAFPQGGYETKLSTYTRLIPETGYQLVDSALKIINRFRIDP
ncbi:MAG: hypothetical protein VB070_08845 [Clostridiaceae bacterium]|nr:hypothetical protein [Clostridiaceae bacterium]